MPSIFQDLCYAVRTLTARPMFALAAIATLAIGIAGTTAVFSVVNGVLLSGLPFRDADRLVNLRNLVGGKSIGAISYPDFIDFQKETRSYDTMAALVQEAHTLSVGTQSERVTIDHVSPEYFDLLHVNPQIGRVFRDGSETNVVVISDALWQKHFARSPAAIGKSLRLDSGLFTVAGVMPAGFRGYNGGSDGWMSLRATEVLRPERAKFHFFESRDIHWMRVIARLKNGVAIEQTRIELQTITERLAREYPLADRDRGADVNFTQALLTNDVRGGLWMLQGAVLLVLMIACGNVAGLLLVRASGRTREFAVRASLGAPRRRLIQLTLAETLLLAIAGSAAGVCLAGWSLNALVRILPAELPRFAEISLNAQVLLSSIAVCVLAALVTGLVPALQTSRTDLQEALRSSSRSATGSVTARRSQQVFVVMQTAFALMLLAGAGMLVRSLVRLASTDVGFDPHNVLTLRLDVPSSSYQGDARFTLPERLVAKLREIPGVKSAAASVADLYRFPGINRGFRVAGQPELTPAELDTFYVQESGPNVFATLRMPVLEGREFSEIDARGSAPVAIVSKTFARRFWPSSSAVGQRVQLGGKNSTRPWMTIVGVVGDAKLEDPRAGAGDTGMLYLPMTQADVMQTFSVLLRTGQDAGGLAPTALRVLHDFDPELPVFQVMTVEDKLALGRASSRSYAMLLGLFAGVALLLACVGVYGLLAYTVNLRTQEIGVRMALGGRPFEMLTLVLASSTRMILVGIAVGVAGSIAVAGALRSLLFEVSALDPLSLSLAAGAILLAATLAAVVPASRAARLNPLDAIRAE